VKAQRNARLDCRTFWKGRPMLHRTALIRRGELRRRLPDIYSKTVKWPLYPIICQLGKSGKYWMASSISKI
jgi:hypothetical protein